MGARGSQVVSGLHSYVMNVQPCDEIGLPSTDGPFWDKIFPCFCGYPQAVLWEGVLWSCSGFYGLFLELVSYDLLLKIRPGSFATWAFGGITELNCNSYCPLRAHIISPKNRMDIGIFNDRLQGVKLFLRKANGSLLGPMQTGLMAKSVAGSAQGVIHTPGKRGRS